MIITVGILAAAPNTFGALFSSMYEDPEGKLLFGIVLMVLLVLITMFVVLFTSAQRKIPVQFAKRVVGRKVYGGQASFIPLKILTAGVMPIIFAQALMFLPGLIAQLSGWDFLTVIFAATHPVYTVCFAILIIVFTYFYTAITVPTNKMSDDLKRSGGFVPGIRPGNETAEYLDSVMSYITFPGSLYLAAIAVFPAIVVQLIGMQQGWALFYGGTSLLIMVGVAIDTIQQVNAYLLNHHYDGLMKTGSMRNKPQI